jgi:hypothetical protein
LYTVPGADALGEFAEVNVSDVTWSPDGQHLICLTGRGLWIANQPDFKEAHLVGSLFGSFLDAWGATWIP